MFSLPSGDLSTLDDDSNLFSQQDDEGLFTLKEMLLNARLTSNGTGNGKKQPRPSSIPAAKKFGGVSFKKKVSKNWVSFVRAILNPTSFNHCSMTNMSNNICPIMGYRHSTVDLSAPIFLPPRV